MKVLSADWVLPVEGVPIANGAIAIRDGRIEAVGTAAELGTGERFPGAAIVPGFVNAHTHLEYAVYAGFGDGLSFAPWLATHIERKHRIGREEMEAIARLGAAECLASGVTTVGDASYAGAAAHACSALGLRAIVYLEVFGSDADGAIEQFREKLEYVTPTLSERVRVGVSPHAPYSCSTGVYRACLTLGVPVMTHFNESQDELDWLLRGEGPMQPVGQLMVEPDGQTGIRRLAAAGVLDARIVAAHCVKVDAEEIGLLVEHDVAVVHCPRSNAILGCGVAPLQRAPRRGSAPRCRNGRCFVGAVARFLRRASLRRVDGSRAQRGRRRTLRRRRARAGDARRRARARSRPRGRIARAGKTSRPRSGLARRHAVRTMGGPRCRGRLRRRVAPNPGYPRRRRGSIRERRVQMARADRRRVTRTKPAVAGSGARERTASIEDTMFFPKLRRHAKWMFVFLALVFGLGFVVFGIGSDQGTGVGDLFRDGGGASGGVSLSEARERVQENPRDAEAKRQLATALQTEGQTSEAIVVLGEYVVLKPKDENALRELASLYLTKATARQREGQEAQFRASFVTGDPAFSTQLEVGEGQALAADPIIEAVTSETNEVVTAAFTDAQESFTNATQTYERIVALTPRDPNVQLELAQTAQQAGNFPRAIEAYNRFLELAPDDPTAPLVREQVKQLQGAQQPAATG